MKLEFSNIKNDSIFDSSFQNLNSENGSISFKENRSCGGIAVLYAPNGVGKSSFAKTLGAELSTDDLTFSAINDLGVTITPENAAFHIIQDQIARNVIKGVETDYLIGPQIQREYELRDDIDECLSEAYNSLKNIYKQKYKVSKVGDYLLIKLREVNGSAFNYIRSIINSRIQGKDIDQDELITFLKESPNQPDFQLLDEDKRNWIVDDTALKDSVIKLLLTIDFHSIISNAETRLIEQHDDALKIIKKYRGLSTCVVCDKAGFHAEDLFEQKQSNRNRIYETLNKETKNLLDSIVAHPGLDSFDPYNIKEAVGELLFEGNLERCYELKALLEADIDITCKEMTYDLIQYFLGTNILALYEEYQQLIETAPELDNEELMLIDSIINNNIGKKLSIERDPSTKNYKLKLDGHDLLGSERDTMALSTGEINFISLAFELLLARHSDKEYIVLDDPISSFDSIYKNKIAYCIIKFLENKKQIILTHNTDLIRLLHVQKPNCFNLHILNNVENGRNGFIPVNEQETKLLINLHCLISLFQNESNQLMPYINDEKLYLMSMIPFLRGYAHISLDENDDYSSLSQLMHGYCDGELDISDIYNRLFGQCFDTEIAVSVEDVLSLDLDNIRILDVQAFPLLSATLKQSLTYYYLRMRVEKTLVEAFGIEAQEMDTLSKIIIKAFPYDRDIENNINRKLRTFFISRKTLLNEFNHFEGNLNVFQPAIDISEAALKQEIDDISDCLEKAIEYADSLH